VTRNPQQPLPCHLLFLYVRFPSTLDTILYRLIGRAESCISGQGALGFILQFFGGFERIFQPYFRNFEYAVHIFDITFDFGCQVFSGFNSARIQRAGKRAGQSACYSRYHMIQGSRVVRSLQFSAVFVLVKIPYTAVDAEMNGLVKSFEMGGSMGSLMFFNGKATGVSDGHGPPPPLETVGHFCFQDLSAECQ
jgi:hypothetical protein